MNLKRKSHPQASSKDTACTLALASILSIGLLGSSALAQQQAPGNPDFVPFTSAIYGAGSASTPTFSLDGTQATYPLVRKDLAVTLGGVAAASETVANGYIGLAEPSTGVFFVDGAIPALVSELPTLEGVLQNAGLAITAIDTQVPGLSQEVVRVHFAQSVTAKNPNKVKALAANLALALTTVHSPQLAVNTSIISDGTSLGFGQAFSNFIGQGVTAIVDDNAIVVAVPRNDAAPLMLGGDVPATESLGVGHTVNVSGNGQALITVELALLPKEVQGVSKALVAAGYKLTSQGGYFTNDSRRIIFVHAVAQTGDPAVLNAELDAVANAVASIQSPTP